MAADNKFADPNKYNAEAITPSDATDLTAKGFRGFYVGVAGDVTIEPVGSTTPLTFTSVPAGSIIPVGFSKINATDTTATDIVGLL